MEKLVIRQNNTVYIYKDVDGAYCDFCGAADSTGKMFMSEWRLREDSEKSDMQICYDCVRQLYKLLPKK